jgi:Subtilase family/Secretion system C-terminal sorting domain
MKRFLLSIIFLSAFLNLSSQTAAITPSLIQKLNTSGSSDIFKINIILDNQVHYGILNNKFKSQKIPISERARTVIRKSIQTAETSQQPIINFLNENSNKVTSYKSLWIINMMTIEATKNIVEQLSYFPGIDYIEEFDHYKGKPIEIMKGESSNSKSVGGIEPGLAAINAPALWAMGYTGKARRYFSIDTGVWPQHPALRDNWLGNYQTLNQAWYGVDSPTPVDKDGTHGTHTAGTVLGLDTVTNDTIGVAFNAYFMVSDPIVTNLADIKPLPEYIAVFQFALNPDGDTTTTNDIPDAINNSWGISGSSMDTTICSGYVTQMFDALEAAGIANVFSAGNSGPNPITIGQPQYVSTGLVNTFTVGAVDGANSSFPITSFSSHGPTACPLTGPLLIKPEVVAPGLNVRSSVDFDNYASFNGTSMAGPHATGAVLLLKEAFPNVSGEEILLALYNSAIDLGVVGEDNTYGRGMIDVLAAFNLLSLTYTPTPPNSESYDIVIDEIVDPNIDIICNQLISPKFILKNKGDSAITSAIITYQLNNETINSINWSGNLNSGDTTSVNLPSITAQNYGDYELKIKATIDTNKIECDYVNNQRVFRFNIRDVISVLPYSEDFENMRLDSSDWIVKNYDGATTWDTTTTGGLPNSSHSATMQMHDYTGSTQLDDLISLNINLPLQDSIFIRFDVAYQELVWVVADTLRVFISNDCGINYTEIYKKGGANLETNDTTTSRFVPIYPSHWRTEYIDITSYAGDNVMIKFQTFNKSGNNLFIDNIWIYEGAEPTSIKETTILNKIFIYPNPTNNFITIDVGNNNLKNASVEIFNILGKSVSNQSITNRKTVIAMDNYSDGIYFIKFSNSLESKTIKIIKE